MHGRRSLWAGQPVFCVAGRVLVGQKRDLAQELLSLSETQMVFRLSPRGPRELVDGQAVLEDQQVQQAAGDLRELHMSLDGSCLAHLIISSATIAILRSSIRSAETLKSQ